MFTMSSNLHGSDGLVTKSCPTAIPRTVAHQATLPWNSPGKNTGVGCHSLLQATYIINLKVKIGFYQIEQKKETQDVNA